MKRISLLLVLLLTPLSIFAQDITFSWDKNKTATYYIGFWGETSGNYTEQSKKITDLRYTLQGLPNKEIFFSVKAFNECGNSSDFSKEISSCDKITPMDPMSDPVITSKTTTETKTTETTTTETTISRNQ
jgi:hypothetical protein